MSSEAVVGLRSWLKAIGVLSAAVNAERDLDSLLDLVAGTAVDLLGLSFCAVMLPNDGEEYLKVAGAKGIPEQYVSHVNDDHAVHLELSPMEGAPASRAFRTGRPHMIEDIGAVPSSRWADLLRRQGYVSILAVPLLTATGVLGTLNSYRDSPHEFSAQEVEQLELLAEHATIALTSARILEGLRDRNELIVRSEEIHNRLLGVAVKSGGVAGIASALTELLHADVVIRDRHGNTLAAEPDESVADAVVETVRTASNAPWNTPGSVAEVGNHVVASVSLDGATVATVWLLNRAGDLDLLGVRAMEHASLVLSLELLRQRTAAEVEQNVRGELLADLLAGADPVSPAIRERAALLSHNLDLPSEMLVAVSQNTSALRSARPRNQDELDIAQQVAAEAVRLTAHQRPRPIIAAVRGFVVALWPTSESQSSGEQVLRRAFALKRPEMKASVAIVKVDKNGIPAAFRGAKGALSLLEANGEQRAVVSLDDLGAAGLLLQFADPAELRRYAERTTGVLHQYDKRHGAELFKTLRAYLNSNLDRGATGELMMLHPNTVSQRLRRIENLAGLNFRSPRSVMEAATAIMLTDVADAVPKSNV